MGRKKGKLDKLSLDVIQCEKDGFGVHYGAWRAAQYEKGKGMTPAKPQGYKHTCLNCGNEFYSKANKPRKYCSEQCKNEYYRSLKRKVTEPKVKEPKGNTPVEKTCPICGKGFTAESYRNKYCGEFCARVGHVQRVQKYLERKAEGAKANG